MNISLVVAQLKAGGMERVVSVCANYWSTKHKVQIVTFDQTPSFYKIEKSINRIVIGGHKTTNPLSTLFQVIKSIRQLKSVISSFESSVIISFGTSTNIQTIISNLFRNIPLIISERSSLSLHHALIWRLGRKFLYRYADLAIYQTLRGAQQFSEKIKSPKYKVIGNPISKEYNCIPEEVTRENIILQVGRHDHNKGQLFLLEALKNIDLSGWKVLFIGKGKLTNTLKEKIDEYGLNDSVFLLGLKKNVFDYYLKSKIFVLPSLIEGYPNVLMEAMVSGCACISFDCENGPRELIDNYKNGVLIPPKDTIQLAKEIKLLIDNPDLIQTYGSSAKKIIHEVNLEKVLMHWDQAILDVSQ